MCARVRGQGRGRRTAFEPLWAGRVVQVLIFSHRARMLKLVEAVMIRKGYTFEVLTGSTPQVALPPPGSTLLPRLRMQYTWCMMQSSDQVTCAVHVLQARTT